MFFHLSLFWFIIWEKPDVILLGHLRSSMERSTWQWTEVSIAHLCDWGILGNRTSSPSQAFTQLYLQPSSWLHPHKKLTILPTCTSISVPCLLWTSNLTSAQKWTPTAPPGAPASALSPDDTKSANAPSSRRAAAPAPPWVVPSVPRAASAGRHQASAAAVPHVEESLFQM